MKLLIPATIAALFVSESLAQRIYATPSATSTSTAPESTPSGYTECHAHDGGELHCTDASGQEARCHQHDGGEWHCEAESASAGTGSSPEGYSDCHSHGTETYCVNDTTGAEDLCHQENGEWHCEAENASTSEEVVDSNGCVQHGTHWHCPEGVAEPCTAQLGEYDIGLHVAALFVLLISSGVGVFLPVIFASKKAARGRFSGSVIYIRDNILRHFGTGVIISTAFIHLLLHAFVMFSSDCLGELSYEPTAPAIMMAATLLIFAIDFLAARAMTKKFSNNNNDGSVSPVSEGSPTVDEKKGGFGHSHDFSAVAVEIMAKDPLSKRAHWEVQLLEAGIIFHSVMIGVTLGAQGGSTFVTTWLAITFHQLFEGMGLGARIARLEWHRYGALKKFLMCLAYNLTTPIGMAIGMGVRQTFSLGATSTLLTIGILDSISAGILLYAGIAQLLVGDWLAGDLRTARTSTVIVAAISMLAGIIAMSVIGKWA